jgi:hypothetical protein
MLPMFLFWIYEKVQKQLKLLQEKQQLTKKRLSQTKNLQQ